MKTKTNELEGAALDWAVAKANQAAGLFKSDPMLDCMRYFTPSTNWMQAGPIIEREKIGVTPMTVTVGDDRGKRYWFANHEDKTDFQDGPTALVAAMRCYCCSKLGAEVDVPEELT
jgi:hypothetical protein